MSVQPTARSLRGGTGRTAAITVASVGGIVAAATATGTTPRAASKAQSAAPAAAPHAAPIAGPVLPPALARPMSPRTAAVCATDGRWVIAGLKSLPQNPLAPYFSAKAAEVTPSK